MKALIVLVALLVTGCAHQMHGYEPASPQDVARAVQNWQDQQNRSRLPAYQIIKPATVCNTQMVYGGWRTSCN